MIKLNFSVCKKCEHYTADYECTNVLSNGSGFKILKKKGFINTSPPDWCPYKLEHIVLPGGLLNRITAFLKNSL